MIEVEETRFGETRSRPGQGEGFTENGNRKAFYGTALVLFLLPILYGSGLLSSGYESKHIAYGGFASTDSGTEIGSRTVHLRQGQTFVVNYEAEIEKGGLAVRVAKSFARLDAPDEDAVSLVRSGKGQLRIPVRETAFYTVYIYGSPRGDGYDVTYTVSWGPE